MSVYRFMALEKAAHSVAITCRVLQVSRSGITPRHDDRSDRVPLGDACLTKRIRELHRKRRGVYGSLSRTGLFRALVLPLRSARFLRRWVATR